jgi:hypothetical protein
LAMNRWSSRAYHPIPVSATTGILTALTFLMATVLFAMVVTVVVSAVRQIIHGRIRAIVVPSVLAGASGGFLLYVVRRVPIEFYRQMYARPRPGIGWTHPGSVIAAAAETIWGTTANWVSLWNQPSGDPHAIYVVNGLVPIAVLLFGCAIASLWRRVELPRFSARLSSATVTLMGGLTVSFLVTYVAWLECGGPSGSQSFVPEGTRAGAWYLVVLAIAGVLIGRTRWAMRVNDRSDSLNL